MLRLYTTLVIIKNVMPKNEYILSVLRSDIQAKSLLNHPFYKDLWNQGMLSRKALEDYTKQYYRFVRYFPLFVTNVAINTPADDPSRDLAIRNLNDELGRNAVPHDKLWEQFASKGLGISREQLLGSLQYSTTGQLIGKLDAITKYGTHAMGSGALLAYEDQVSAVAESKDAGLREFYGVSDPEALEFFKVHAVVDKEHKKTWEEIIRNNVHTEVEGKRVRGALNDSLDAQLKFLDGIMDANDLWKLCAAK